ncbi:MAG: hypothetical protein L0H93_11355 [Nocardioides sp.]|nr:hypothetical protein [Nocardioides sp.]
MSSTPLGMPALPPRTAQPVWKQAWDTALYGAGGYLRSHPVGFAERNRDALLSFLVPRIDGHRDVVLFGAAGRLATDLAGRFTDTLFRPDLPKDFDGMVISVDWLAHVPTHVVQADDDGRPRVVHVDPVTGKEQLGLVLDDAGVPPTLRNWQEQNWPLPEPFQRAEIGTTREAAWRDVTSRLGKGVALAIDPGHTHDVRPTEGSLRCPDGQPPIPDTTRDLIADVALDALAAAVGGRVFDEDGCTGVLTGADDLI